MLTWLEVGPLEPKYIQTIFAGLYSGALLGKKAADDEASRVSVPPMKAGQVGSFIRSLSNLEIGGVRELVGSTKPIASWPEHCQDCMLEPDDGIDVVGSRPQRGIEFLKSELGARIMKI